LPRRSGLEVLEHAKKDLVWKAIPITVLTTSRHSNDIRAAYGFGVNSYVVKPVQSGAFYEVIDRLKAYWLATNQALPES
jgi:CheY-like chemotaxis protein